MHTNGGRFEAECGPEQLHELKTCLVELKKLSEEKVESLVYEKNIKEDNPKLW